MSKKYIACQGEAEGFGHQACLTYIKQLGAEGRDYAPLPRHSAEQALSSLMSHDVERAVIPLTSAADGYFAENLALLAEFKGGHVTAETAPEQEGYCLAIPRAQMQELAQAGFSASLGHRGAEGWLLPWGDQQAFRDRVDVIFATPEAERRCALKLASFRGAGVDVKRPETDAEPAREVLNLARRSLESDRSITTTSDKSGELQLQSQVKIKSQAQSRPLYAALLPREVVSRFKDDYILVDEAMDDRTETRTRFLVVERKSPGQKSKEKKGADPFRAIGARLKEIVGASRPARLLVKVDSRGERGNGLADIFSALDRSGAAYAPVYLHRQPDALPAVFDIEFDGDRAKHNQIDKVVNALFDGTRDRNPQLLGVFESASPAFDHSAFQAKDGFVETKVKPSIPAAFLLIIGGLIGGALVAYWPFIASLWDRFVGQ